MKATTRDNILYLTIALAIVAVWGLVAWYQDAHGQQIHMPIPEHALMLFVATAVIFGYALKDRRKSWRNPRFWVVLSAAFILFLPLEWRIVLYTSSAAVVAALSGPELFVLLVVLNTFAPDRGARITSRRLGITNENAKIENQGP